MLFASSIVVSLSLIHARALPSSQSPINIDASVASSYWLSNIEHQGAVPYGGSAGYSVFRNVMDYGFAFPTSSQPHVVFTDTSAGQRGTV